MNRLLKITAMFLIFLSSPVFAGKVTIAIGDIEYRAKDSSENKRYSAYGRGSREDTRAFVDMVTTALVKTRKFNVIERDRMAEILKEQGLSLEGIANGGYSGGKFNLQGVDYILTGAITEYGESKKGLSVGGFSTATRTATMAVDVRVLDVANGSIGFADTVEASAKGGNALNVKGFSTAGNSSSGTLLGTVMRETATNVTNLVVSSIYPIKVVAITSKGTVMLNYGNGFLSEGDNLEIFSQGESFVDPDTGEELGSEEELVATVKIFSAQPKFSKASVVTGGSVEKGMIARVAKPAAANEPKKKKKKLW